jgi:hypothetical protein
MEMPERGCGDKAGMVGMTAEWGELQITKDENGISQEETEGTKGRYDRRTLNVERRRGQSMRKKYEGGRQMRNDKRESRKVGVTGAHGGNGEHGGKTGTSYAER